MQNKKWKSLLWGVGLIILLDQITKYAVVHFFRLGSVYPVIPYFLDLVHYRNAGAAFGMLSQWNSSARHFFFIGISGVAIGILGYYLYKTPIEKKGVYFSLILILSGALSNLIDRMIRGNVVDFILFHWYDKVAHFQFLGRSYAFELAWPAFNVADSAITLGVIFLFMATLRDS